MELKVFSIYALFLLFFFCHDTTQPDPDIDIVTGYICIICEPCCDASDVTNLHNINGNTHAGHVTRYFQMKLHFSSYCRSRVWFLDGVNFT